MYPKLLERHHLFKRHKPELFLIAIYSCPDRYIPQSPGTVKTELKVVLVVHLDLQRLSNIKAPLAGIKKNIRRFVVVQQIIRVFRIVVCLCQGNGKGLDILSLLWRQFLIFLTTDRQ